MLILQCNNSATFSPLTGCVKGTRDAVKRMQFFEPTLKSLVMAFHPNNSIGHMFKFLHTFFNIFNILKLRKCSVWWLPLTSLKFFQFDFKMSTETNWNQRLPVRKKINLKTCALLSNAVGSNVMYARFVVSGLQHAAAPVCCFKDVKRQERRTVGSSSFFLGLLTRADTKLTSDSLWDSESLLGPVLSSLPLPLLYPFIPPSPIYIPVAPYIPTGPK